MAIYHCNHCDNFIDYDWEPGEVDPEDDRELICPSCKEKYEMEKHKELLIELHGINKSLEQDRIRSMKLGSLDPLIGD